MEISSLTYPTVPLNRSGGQWIYDAAWNWTHSPLYQRWKKKHISAGFLRWKIKLIAYPKYWWCRHVHIECKYCWCQHGQRGLTGTQLFKGFSEFYFKVS